MGRHCILLAAFLCASSYASAAQPNVLLIISDDVGFADIGTSNTPSLNQLAAESADFTHAYAYALCSPTRAALQTGRWAERSTVYVSLPWNSTGGMASSEVTLAEQFKQLGYSTALVGKWHLGQQEEFSPLAQGYDHHYGTRGGAVDHLTHLSLGPNSDWQGPLDWWRDDTLIEEPGYTTTLEAHEAERLIETMPQPWFITVSWNATHAPRQAPNGKPSYVRQLRAMDKGIGAIVHRLDALGLGPDTIVWFLNDNGGYPTARNGGLKGQKGSLWEGGIRVRELVRWPGRIVPGKREGNVHVIDILPTLMDFVNSVPVQAPDGVSLAPTLLENAPVPTRPLFWSTKVKNPNTAVNDGRYKLALVKGMPYLFDLENDWSELNNLADSDPLMVQSLTEQIAAWRTQVVR